MCVAAGMEVNGDCSISIDEVCLVRYNSTTIPCDNLNHDQCGVLKNDEENDDDNDDDITSKA